MTSSSHDDGARVRTVAITERTLTVHLDDGRSVSVPLRWYPRLQQASPQARANWRIAGGGFGIHWPDVDEDLSVEGILRGAAAPGFSTSAGG